MGDLISYIFSPEFFNAVLRMSTPLLFVAMAAVVGEKSNILCMALEGMMLVAAFGGVVGSAVTHSLLLGALTGILAGMVIAVIFAYFVLVLKTEPMLVGLALNIFASGSTVYLLYLITGSKSDTTNLPSLVFPNIEIPLIKDIPMVGQIVSGQNVLTYCAFAAVALVYVLIYKTTLGLRIRAVGEDSAASKSVGINDIRIKFIAVMISGVLASLGGIFMSMGYLPHFTRDMISGRGFIGIAAQCLGGGHPIVTMLCTLVFGGAGAIGNVAQSYRMPSQFASMLPYLATLIGLLFMNIRFMKKTKRQAKV